MQYNAGHLKKVGQCRTGRHHDTYFAIKIQYVKDPHKISMENIFMGKTGLPPPPFYGYPPFSTLPFIEPNFNPPLRALRIPPPSLI